MNDPLLNEIRGMLVFARVVDAGSFSSAAKRIGISRAVVSYQIKQLEQRLGVRLLNRSTRTTSTTTAGRTYYERCKIILEQAERAHSDIQNLREEAVGRVSLACPVNLGLRWIVPLANAFRRRYPNIELDINFSENITDLIQSGTDIAVRSGPLQDSELHAVKLTDLTRHICASPEYFTSRSIPQTIEQLQHHQWIVYSRTSNKLSLNKGNASFTFEIKGSLNTNDAAARLQFALAGQGLAVIPFYDAEQVLANGELIEIMRDYQLPKLELFAVFPQGATQAKAVELMLDMLKKYPPHKVADINLFT
ncbi:LysR family transcriptional regulator [Aliiglaciecola sp. M165]|uniref:LysR family transcriptional regulator n=1 Tax=Aliiglaciecola sp. M165 TaxID=2593649 RepID=UPI00117E6D4B|nr:LysR family transcriptional regulator [Aliiglaciecola sp. M165]TRY29043.1 LysR family transcriptional regulator [Aliiglaciecola sp. M165]